MITRNFRISIAIQVFMIGITGLLMVWSFTREDLVVARMAFATLWLVLILYLIHYINRKNQTLKTFFESVRSFDTIRQSSGSGRFSRELDQMYNEITSIIRKIEIERESDRQYLKHMVEHIGVGIISFTEEGKVEIINEAAKSLFGVKYIDHVSALSLVSPELPDILTSAGTGRQVLQKLNIGNERVTLTLNVKGFRLLDRNIRLVSLQDIKRELEIEELEAWQKLIRVLTHEIMNSITPVNTLTSAIIGMFEENGVRKKARDIDDSLLDNALEGLHSIEKRSKGLAGFVKSYRSLTKIKKPDYTFFSIDKMFQHIRKLEEHDISAAHIHLNTQVNPQDLKLWGDEKLVEQVLMNLINNSIQAMTGRDDESIWLKARQFRGHIIIEAGDNGPGIPEDIMDHIFVPFFTTRKEGSGIGLSLSRQILWMHGGTISVRSRPNSETLFTLKFPVFPDDKSSEPKIA